jgi:hypothetical protein
MSSHLITLDVSTHSSSKTTRKKLTHLLIQRTHTHNVTNSMKKSLSWEANSNAVKKFYAFYGILWFTTVFIRARHWSQSWARCIQSKPSHCLLLPSHVHLCLPSGLFPWGFQTKILYAFLIFHTRAICLAHLILPDLITLIVYDYASPSELRTEPEYKG